MKVAELIIAALAEHGVTQVWGVVGDALNPLDRGDPYDDRIEWTGSGTRRSLLSRSVRRLS